MLSAHQTGAAVEIDGFAIVEEVLSRSAVDRLIHALEHFSDIESMNRQGSVFAVRNLIDASPEVKALAESAGVRSLVKPVLGTRFFPVRGILFDKIPGANWKVPWHQDVTIAVRERIETQGFGPWSTKAGVLHVQPPASVLEHMVSVRLHLDQSDQDNGALRVIPGSHRHGRIPESAIPLMRQTPEVVCAVGSGGALLMRPLLLHASSPSIVPAHRRVIHLDFASVELPNGLQWFTESSSTSDLERLPYSLTDKTIRHLLT